VTEPPLFRWEPNGPYVVAFTTRVGGVSEGPFDSLNLGRRTGDDVERVDENRRRLCALTGGEPEALAMNFQQQSAIVNRAERGRRGTPGDALWTEERGLPVLALGADCLVIALARRNGDRPGVAVVHAGWRGLLAGVVESAVTTLGGRVDAVIGPSIGPCCYEIGTEVAERFEPRFLRRRRLDLWSAGEHALREAGARSVERLDLCTQCNEDLFFSHRRTGKPRGVQGVIALVA
jgi:polyphenol oxidase